MQVFLRDLAPGQQYAIQFRSNDGKGNTSDWSQVQRFTTTNDTMPPADVLNLSVFATDTSFIAQWDHVSTNADGTNLTDFRYYHIHVASVGASGTGDFYVLKEVFELTKAMNIQTFGTFQTALTFTVTAVDLTYNESIHPTTITLDPAAPPTPSTPVVSSYLGLLMVTWDGLSAGGGAMPANTNYAEVHASTINGFTPTGSTMVGRVFADGSGSKFVIPGLTYGTTYYIRLVAVNLVQKRSGPSVQATGIPARISGLDIQNGQINVNQINFTAKDIGGANAYYQTSQPVGTGIKEGDVWYDTDDQYKTYRFTSGTWVLAPEIGFIAGTKIITGTLTADAVGTNLLIASSANIGNAVIDDAHIANISAAKIITGSIQANQSIIAGNSNAIHAEMKDTGFYVYAPGISPDGGITPAPMNPAVKMGTGDGDTFSVTDPNHTDQTLASISQSGVGSFQRVAAQTGLTIKGRDFETDWMGTLGGTIVGEGLITNITGLNQSGAQGIRSEYGIGQFSFPVISGHTYQITARLKSWYIQDGGEPHICLRLQQDQRTSADIAANVAPTAVTISSFLLMDEMYEVRNAGWSYDPRITTFYRATFTGIASVGFSFYLNAPPANDSVIKIYDGSFLEFQAIDNGKSRAQSGSPNNFGGTLYSWTAPPPPPPPATQNYSGTWHMDWIRSYQGNNNYMSNTNGNAYQGQDPSGYNGNQKSLMGWNTDFASMLSGATNISASLYIYYAHWYYNSGGTGVWGWSAQFGDPGGASFPGGAPNDASIGGIAKPGSWSGGLGAEWVTALQNGSMRALMLGPGPTTSYTYYGYATDCAITINYTK